MDMSKYKEIIKEKHSVRVIMNDGAEKVYRRYHYYFEDSDGNLFSVRRKTPRELQFGAARVIAEMLGLDYHKADIMINQTEVGQPILFGYAYRDAHGNTIVIVERDKGVAVMSYKENVFSASRFVEAVEHLEIPIVAFVEDVEE